MLCHVDPARATVLIRARAGFGLHFFLKIMIYSPLFVTFCTTASVFFSGTVYVGLQYDESLVDYRGNHSTVTI